MFRPTHFVILFAVFLCAYAAPAPPASSAVEPAVKADDPKKAEGKADLATDASTHLLYSYGYGPSVYTHPVGWAGRSIGLDIFGRLIDPLHPTIFLKHSPLLL